VLQMRERMEEMNRQMQGFVDYVRTEMLTRMQQQQPGSGLVPVARPVMVPQRAAAASKATVLKHAVVVGRGAAKGSKAR
jgi:hypothetical protein